MRLPKSKRVRLAMWVVAVLAALALLFLVIFPWVDRTFVNRPAIESPQGAAVPVATAARS
jgi:quinol-cytochrome oxidoreductase complex cytochrome b subunit